MSQSVIVSTPASTPTHQSFELVQIAAFGDAVKLLEPLQHEAFVAKDEFAWHKIWSAKTHLQNAQKQIGAAYFNGEGLA